MPTPRQRLALFVGALSTLAVVILVLSPVSEQGLRDAIEPFGVGGPLAYVVLSALLGLLFVPGPILAGASGLLFGTATGVAVTIASSVLSSVLAVQLAHRAGRPGVIDLEHPRVRLVEELLERYGTRAVIVQRLVPGVPDTPCSYLYGLAGLASWKVALGTAIGASPRAFSYTALGDGLGGGSNATAIVGGVTLVATAVVGALAGTVLLRRARRDRAANLPEVDAP